MKLWPSTRRGWIWFFVRLGLILMLIGGLPMFVTKMPGLSHTGALLPLSSEEATTSANLKRHTEKLASEIGERNTVLYESLLLSEAYIRKTFEELGYAVSDQPYEADGKIVRNIEIEFGGDSLPDETVVIGAHYDSAVGTPGANDNASGTAALLELARLLKGEKLQRKVRLVAFVNEEPPFFMRRGMGSLVYAKRCRERKERIAGMISLETMGCYTNSEASQHYPVPFKYFYPSTGNFVAFVGNFKSRELVRQCAGTFRSSTKFPSEGAATPGWIKGVGWSDHWSFWMNGYKALMVTDTAFFRYQYYHTPSDTPEKLNYDDMARVVHGLVHVIESLAKGA